VIGRSGRRTGGRGIYRGKVRFTDTAGNPNLPSDYTFGAPPCLADLICRAGLWRLDCKLVRE
jgi:hypothetical protein